MKNDCVIYGMTLWYKGSLYGMKCGYVIMRKTVQYGKGGNAILSNLEIIGWCYHRRKKVFESGESRVRVPVLKGSYTRGSICNKRSHNIITL